MCDFHLRDKCFHPEKVGKGLVALPCKAHDCKHCTDEGWRIKKIENELAYYSYIIAMTLPRFSENKTTIITKS